MKVLIIGVCQASDIGHGFWLPELRGKYRARIQNFDLQKTLDAQNDANDADIVIIQQHKDWDRYPFNDDVLSRPEVINIPHLSLMSLWPYDCAHWKMDYIAGAHPQKTYHLDGMLGELRNSTPDPDERMDSYRKAAQPDDITRLWQIEQQRLISIDSKFGTTVGQFIVDNLQHRRLFHSSHHPAGLLYSQLMNDIFDRIGVKQRCPEDYPQLDHWGIHQVPIHPTVIDALKLSWVTPEDRYQFKPYEPLTWEEYTKGYIELYG